jgi:hypothetical protein
MQRSGRWSVQLHSGRGHHNIRYGPAEREVGPFYAYRDAANGETLGEWHRRVTEDLAWGERQLRRHVPGYTPLAFAPPFGAYGQIGTNDPRIPRELLARLHQSFAVVFTQDLSGFAAPGTGRAGPLGRIEITRDVSERELRSLLVPAPR